MSGRVKKGRLVGYRRRIGRRREEGWAAAGSNYKDIHYNTKINNRWGWRTYSFCGQAWRKLHLHIIRGAVEVIWVHIARAPGLGYLDHRVCHCSSCVFCSSFIISFFFLQTCFPVIIVALWNAELNQCKDCRYRSFMFRGVHKSAAAPQLHPPFLENVVILRYSREILKLLLL